MAFRSLSRPSSAPSAKAFALRPFSLDLFALPFLFENYSFDIVVFFTQFCLLKKLYFTSSIAFLFGFQGSFFQGNYFRLSQGSGLRIRTYLPYRGLTPAGKSARSPSYPIFFRVSRPLKALVGSNGFEPSTSRLSGARSNRLSYEPISQHRILAPGGDEEVRTLGLLRARQALSHLSYTPVLPPVKCHSALSPPLAEKRPRGLQN